MHIVVKKGVSKVHDNTRIIIIICCFFGFTAKLSAQTAPPYLHSYA